MKKSQLRQLIKEEIQNLSQEYTVEDLYQMIKDGEIIKVSDDGGHSVSTYGLTRDYMVNPIENFEKFVLNHPRLKNTTYIMDDKNSFIKKGTEGYIDAISKYYDKIGSFKGD